MQNSRFDYSSIHIEPPSDLAEDIVTWSREHVSDDEIFVSWRDFTYGREDEIHATILYGIHSEKSDHLQSVLTGEKPIHIQLGKVRIFSNRFKFDVLVIEVISPDLIQLNKKLTEKIPITNKYGAYSPHFTIAYVKKGAGWKYSRLDRWKGRKFISDYLIFSSKNGTKERIVF